MRILFDQGTPVPLRAFLTGHSVRTVSEEQWSTLQNGELLSVAEAAGFDLLLTTDKNIRYQQNLTARKIAVVVLANQQWPTLREHLERVIADINAATPGSYREV